MFQHQMAYEFRKVSIQNGLVFLGVSEATSFEAFPKKTSTFLMIFFRQFQKQYPGMHRGPVEALQFFSLTFMHEKYGQN